MSLTLEDLQSLEEDAVVIADDLGAICFVNDRFQGLFGWSLEEIVGQPLTTIIPPRLRDAHHLGFSRFLASGTGVLLNIPIDLDALDKAGREFPAEHLIVAEMREGHWLFGARIRKR